MYARIVTEVISVEEVSAQVADIRSGAVVTFIGTVRDHDAGWSVNAIDYSAHPVAEQVLSDLVAQFLNRDGVHGVAAVHRVGHLKLGELAMVVSISAEHREQAFATASDLVNAIKQKLPVWKCQWLVDGSHIWSGMS